MQALQGEARQKALGTNLSTEPRQGSAWQHTRIAKRRTQTGKCPCPPAQEEEEGGRGEGEEKKGAPRRDKARRGA